MKFLTIEQKIYEGKELTEEEESYILGKLNDYWENHPDLIYRFPRWRKILAWVAGYQYTDIERHSGKLRPVNLEKQRKLVFNRLKAFLKKLVSKAMSVVPALGVVPKTTEYEDLRAAEVGDAILESLYDKLNFDMIRRQFFTWIFLINRAVLRVFWNEKKEGLVGIEKITEEVDGVPIETEIKITEPGDIDMEVVSPFACRVDPLSIVPSKWRWFLYGEKVDADALEEEYGLPHGTVDTDTHLLDDAPAIPFEDIIPGFSSAISQPGEDIVGRTCIKYEFWTPKIYIFATKNKILEYGVNPYGRIPFFTYSDSTIPIDNYGYDIIFNDSIIRDMIPVQREYNRFVSLMSLALERAAKIKVLSPLSALLNKRQVYDDGSIVIIDYNNQMGEPHQLKLDPIPPYVFNLKQDLERELESVSNIHEVSFGRLPERASHASGTLVSLLIEQDDSILDPIIREADKVFSDAWTLALEIIQHSYTRPRLFKLVGRNLEDSVRWFSGADLRGNTDVAITTQLALPKSKALRAEWILKLAERGLIDDKKMVLELLEFAEAKKLYPLSLVHEKKAMRENYLIEITPNITSNDLSQYYCEWDDHEAHLKIHLRDRLSPKYDKYTAQQKAALNNMIQFHQSRLQPQPNQPQAGGGASLQPAMQAGQQPATAEEQMAILAPLLRQGGLEGGQ